ncbi:EAL domain-containing protein [Sphingopyxis sp. MWB1]|uniref:EAL domain-containing protein n=1 Tax=Sphingopyxis sp. MWB1 TaxID=1537715 RepID=UPI000519F21F|nr:EAL domain-containing protein [Sphingopyxis sp. MWB1]
MIISWRAIGVSLLLALAVGLSDASEPIDRMVEAAIGRLAWRPVSGDIAVVALDEKTLEHFENGDVSMTQHAKIVEAIDKAGAARLFIDFIYDRREKDADFPKLTRAVREMGERVGLAVEAKSTRQGATQFTRFPTVAFGPKAQRVPIGWEYEYWQVWRLPVALEMNGQIYPSMSAEIARRYIKTPTTYALDYSYRTDSIPVVSALDLLTGKAGTAELAGKDVIFAATAPTFQDTHFLPGHDRIPGAFIHLIGAETLKRGLPSDIGWWLSLAAAGIALAVGLWYKRGRHFYLAASAAILLVIGGKIWLAAQLVTTVVGPALVLVAAIAANVTRQRRKQSAQRQNPVSGLPNFEALRNQAAFGSHTVIAAKLVNFDDLTAFLPGEGSQQLIEQVARRLQLASQGTALHHDPDGSFAWLVPYYQHSQIESQLAGLAALFNAPLTIGELRVDVSIAFGVNDEFEGSNGQRLAAALVAAEHAIRTRALWTKYTPRGQEDAGWQLSFHSELEDALIGGDIWVAYQPQYHIDSGSLVGIEALARWSHPTRGPIPPDEFIVQAEKSQDIYRLTLFVMDQAIRSSAQLRDEGIVAHMSVNLSAALLDHADLVSTIRVMLTAHHLPPEMLTIEITETAQIENSRQARQTLSQLRRAGVRLSIDDYGTGQSNLEYLTEIEADEIKIDKRFVGTMCDSSRNFEIVKSTIDLAHRLGAVAVAEGIEDRATMQLLGQLNCDVGQGYYLGKPQNFADLSKALHNNSKARSA